MNLLVAEMRRSLKELDLGLKGELTITSDMEDLSDSLFFDQVIISSLVHKNTILWCSRRKTEAWNQDQAGYSAVPWVSTQDNVYLVQA